MVSECRPEGARCRAFLIIPNSYGVRELSAPQSGCSRLQCDAASTFIFMRRNDQARRVPLGPELERAILAYIKATNSGPKPLRWAKGANDILAGIRRFCLRIVAANP